MTTSEPRAPSRRTVIGVDPGPTPGVVVLKPGPPLVASIFQCDADSLLWLVQALIRESPYAGRFVLAMEKFVVGPRSARSAASGAGRRTRDMVGALTAIGQNQVDLVGRPLATVVVRSASEVMPWASDRRLSLVGLYAATKGMPHARAAARHALYAAVRDDGLPDPLSRKAREATP